LSEYLQPEGDENFDTTKGKQLKSGKVIAKNWAEV
jgi:hypothetical protein